MRSTGDLKQSACPTSVLLSLQVTCGATTSTVGSLWCLRSPTPACWRWTPCDTGTSSWGVMGSGTWCRHRTPCPCVRTMMRPWWVLGWAGAPDGMMPLCAPGWCVAQRVGSPCLSSEGRWFEFLSRQNGHMSVGPLTHMLDKGTWPDHVLLRQASLSGLHLCVCLKGEWELSWTWTHTCANGDLSFSYLFIFFLFPEGVRCCTFESPGGCSTKQDFLLRLITCWI